MYMRDWIAKLDDFLRLSEREILTHAGKIGNEAAVAKAEVEYEHFRITQLADPTEVERHFLAAVKKFEQLPSGEIKKRKGRK